MAEREPRPVLQPQIRRLIETATALRTGTSTHFAITRLTSIKSLCKQPEVAARFAFDLAERTLKRMQTQAYRSYIDPADWAHYQSLVSEAVAMLGEYLQTPSEQGERQLRSMLSRAQAVQTYSGEQVWGCPLRTIHSNEVLIIEDALGCITSPWAASYWAYQTAKDYAERYNPRYGTGLIPESLPLLDDIIAFWTRRDPER